MNSLPDGRTNVSADLEGQTGNICRLAVEREVSEVIILMNTKGSEFEQTYIHFTILGTVFFSSWPRARNASPERSGLLTPICMIEF